MKAHIPFRFKTPEQHTGIPRPVAQQWREMSHFFFFHNALLSRDDIERFLTAQTLERLSEIAFAFDVVAEDLIGEVHKREGGKLEEEHRSLLVSTILDSVTR